MFTPNSTEQAELRERGYTEYGGNVFAYTDGELTKYIWFDSDIAMWMASIHGKRLSIATITWQMTPNVSVLYRALDWIEEASRTVHHLLNDLHPV